MSRQILLSSADPLKLELIRRLAVSWNTAGRMGAPTVEPAAPYGSLRIYDDLAPFLNLPVMEYPDQPSAEHQRQALDLHLDVCGLFGEFLLQGELAPGTYATVDRSGFLHDAQRLSWSIVDIRRHAAKPRGLRGYLRTLKSIWNTRESISQAEERGMVTRDMEIDAGDLARIKDLRVRLQKHDRRSVADAGSSKDRMGRKVQEWIGEERLYPVPEIDPDQPYRSAVEMPDLKHHQRLQDALQVFLQHAQLH